MLALLTFNMKALALRFEMTSFYADVKKVKSQKARDCTKLPEITEAERTVAASYMSYMRLYAINASVCPAKPTQSTYMYPSRIPATQLAEPGYFQNTSALPERLCFLCILFCFAYYNPARFMRTRACDICCFKAVSFQAGHADHQRRPFHRLHISRFNICIMRQMRQKI